MHLRIGLIGTGKAIGVADDHFKGIKAVSGWKLAAVYDISKENAELFAERNQLSESIICSDLDEFYNRVDAVSICTDNKSHIELIHRSIEKKVAIMCEKPLAPNYRLSKELADAAESAGVVNYMAMQYRYHPYAQLIKEIIESGELGEVFYYRHKLVGWRLASPKIGLEWRMQEELSGPGALIDFGVHQVDLLHYFLHKSCGDIVDVQADRFTVIKERDKLDGSGKGKVTNDDIAVVIARLGNGALVTLNNSRVVPPEGSGLEIVGSKGSVWMDSEENVYLRKRDDNGFWAERVKVPIEERHRFPGLARGKQYDEFLGAIVHGIPHELDFSYGAKTVRVIDAAVKAARENRRVCVSEIR